ncbi:hypothetical protein [Mycolicibacter minnesotensis]
MTSPALQTTPAGLRELAQRCTELASQVAPSLPEVTASAWQATGAATTTVNTGAGKTALSMRGRMTARANKLSSAANQYEAMDHDAAGALAAVPQRPEPPALPTKTGADGGAGGLGIPR